MGDVDVRWGSSVGTPNRFEEGSGFRKRISKTQPYNGVNASKFWPPIIMKVDSGGMTETAAIITTTMKKIQIHRMIQK